MQSIKRDKDRLLPGIYVGNKDVDTSICVASNGVVTVNNELEWTGKKADIT
jgi:hypothetical protein